MEATRELRRILDDKGIPHFDYSDESNFEETRWDSSSGDEYFVFFFFFQTASSRLETISYPSPQKAVEKSLGKRAYTPAEWCSIAEIVGDAMDEAYNMDKGSWIDPLQNLGDYVDKILDVAYTETAPRPWNCRIISKRTETEHFWECEECHWKVPAENRMVKTYNYCPQCGRKVVY